VRAELTDGRVVSLIKDCACITHEGPCWLHTDQLHRMEQRRHLDAGNWRGWLAVEGLRLREKIWAMQSRGIVRLLADSDDERDAVFDLMPGGMEMSKRG